MNEPILVQALRTLHREEIETLNIALRLLAASKDWTFSWSAKSMLEQNMPENFLWASK